MIRSFALLLFLFSTLASASKQPALRNVLLRVEQATLWESAIAIADLDETLVDSTPRRFATYRDVLTKLCPDRSEGDCASVAGWNIQEFYALANRYDQTPLLEALNVKPGKFRQKLVEDSLSAYLSGEYENLDQAIPGAVEFVQRLKSLNVRVFFVSSRSKTKQLASTLESLRSLGLLQPGEEKDVILKPEGMSSIDFKRWAFERIRGESAESHASVEVVMENEPENMNAMTEIFPEAQAIFVEGALLKDEPLKGSPLRIRDYR